RLGEQSVLHVQPTSALVQVGSLIAGVAILAVAAWSTRAGARSPYERSAEFGLGVTAMVLAGAIAWFPHFTYLLIPLFAACGQRYEQICEVGKPSYGSYRSYRC